MAQFILAVSHRGPITAEFAAQPAPDPAMFGLPAEDDGTRTDPLLAPEHRDLHALRARLRRAARGVDADRPGRRRSSRTASWRTAAPWRPPSGSAPTAVIFPSDHGGFLGGEYGQAGDPDAFAAKLREVLAEG